MGKKLNLLKHPPPKAGAPLSDAQLEAWAATERDPKMRELLYAYSRGTPVTSTEDKPRDIVRDPLALLWAYFPMLIWIHEGFGSSRLLDAPAGYLGTGYHVAPAQVVMLLVTVLPMLTMWVVNVLWKDTERRHWSAAVLACFVLLTYWQLVPPTFTRWFGTPHSEIAQVKESFVRSVKSSLVPTRLVVARPGGAEESIDYYTSTLAEDYRGTNERRLGLKTGAGDWVRLSGERSALGFLVHSVDRAPIPP